MLAMLESITRAIGVQKEPSTCNHPLTIKVTTNIWIVNEVLIVRMTSVVPVCHNSMEDSELQLCCECPANIGTHLDSAEVMFRPTTLTANVGLFATTS